MVSVGRKRLWEDMLGSPVTIASDCLWGSVGFRVFWDIFCLFLLHSLLFFYFFFLIGWFVDFVNRWLKGSHICEYIRVSGVTRISIGGVYIYMYIYNVQIDVYIIYVYSICII